MIEWLAVRIPAEASVEFSSPELTLCADSYSVSFLSRITVKDSVVLLEVQVAAYI